MSNQADAEPRDAAAPYHLGIIMDGNGRWAKARGLPRAAGHQAGVDNIRRILEHCVQCGVKVLSIYAFSTENWGRPPEEVSGLMRLLGLTIQRQLNELHKRHAITSVSRSMWLSTTAAAPKLWMPCAISSATAFAPKI